MVQSFYISRMISGKIRDKEKNIVLDKIFNLHIKNSSTLLWLDNFTIINSNNEKETLILIFRSFTITRIRTKNYTKKFSKINEM